MHSTQQQTSSPNTSDFVLVNITHVEAAHSITRQDSNSSALQRTVTTDVTCTTELTADILRQIRDQLDSLIRKTSELPADGTYTHL